jgi:uncharacterized membrane protein YcfT
LSAAVLTRSEHVVPVQVVPMEVVPNHVVPDQLSGLRREPAKSSRLDWIDLSRGLVMVFVVVLHVGVYFSLPLMAPAGGPAFDFWSLANLWLGAIRMPSLLVISGWLASSAIASGLRAPKVRKRLAANAWLYLLWIILYAGEAFALHAEKSTAAVAPGEILEQLLAPDNTLWFLAALVWYVAILAAFRRVPKGVVLGVLLLLGFASSTVFATTTGLWVKIPQFFVFFALGAYGRRPWEWLARRPLPAMVGGGLLAWASIRLMDLGPEVGIGTYPGQFLLSVASVSVLFGTACLATRHAAHWTRPLVYIGRHTVPVYVLHFPILLWLSTATSGPLRSIPMAILADPVGRWVFPMALAGLIVGLSLGAEKLAGRAHLGWLFRLPRRPNLAPLWSALKSHAARDLNVLNPNEMIALGS